MKTAFWRAIAPGIYTLEHAPRRPDVDHTYNIALLVGRQTGADEEIYIKPRLKTVW
jgi:hypothetical protein